MSVHIAFPHLHLPHPDWGRVRRHADTAALVASGSGWVCAAVTAVGLGYGRHLAAAVVAAVVAYVGYLVGAHRTAAVLNERHRAAMEGVQRVNSALQRTAARRFAELAVYADADRDPHMSRKDRHLNSARRVAGVPLNERSSR